MVTKVKYIADGVVNASQITLTTASTGDNTTAPATTAFVQQEMAALVDSSPSTLDTLNELAAALGDDPNFATTTATAIGLKAPIASPTFTGTPLLSNRFKTQDGSAQMNMGQWDGSNHRIEADSNRPFKIYSYNTSGGMALGISGSDKLTINGDGSGITVAGQVLVNTDIRLGSEGVRLSSDGNGEFGIGYGQTATNSRFTVYNNTAAAFRVLPNGNVGIGTASPEYNLHVEKLSASANVDLLVRNTGTDGTSNSRIMSYVSGASGGDPKIGLGITGVRDYFFRIDNSDLDKLKLDTNDTDILTIDTSGNVGIGTASPNRKLHIKDSSAYQLQLEGNNSFWNVGTGWSGYYQDSFLLANSSGEKFVIDPNGKVGIGISSPSSLLNVHSSTAPKITISNGGGTSPNPELEFLRQSGVAARIVYEVANKDLVIKNDSTLGNIQFKQGSVTQVEIEGSTGQVKIANGGSLNFDAAANGNFDIAYKASDNTFNIINNSSSAPMGFHTNSTERMNISATGVVTVHGVQGRPVTIDSGISTKATAGGWSMAYAFEGSSGTDRGGFGGFGYNDGLTYYYIGPAHNASIMTIGTNNIVAVNGDLEIGAVSTNGSKLRVNGKIVAGDIGSTGGDVLLEGYYGNGATAVIGSEYSSGGVFLGYGVQPSVTTQGQFLSSSPAALSQGAYVVSDTHKWYTVTGGSSVAVGSQLTTMVERMRLKSNGYFGIGTDAPATNLHVHTTSSHSEIRVSSSASGNGTVPAVSLNNTAVEWGMGILADNHLHFRENTASYQSRLTIADGGNVGIGNTNPSEKLEIGENSSTTSVGYIRLRGHNTIEGNIYKDATYSIHMDSNANNGPIRIDGSKQILGITGNVGMGTETPASKVHIKGNSNNTVSQANANLNVEGDGGNGLVIGTMVASTYASYIQSGYVDNFATAVYPLLLNPSGGNVGIGATAPNTRLQIASSGANPHSATLTKGVNHSGLTLVQSNNANDMVGVMFGTGPDTNGSHWSGITGSRSDNASHWGTQLNFYTHNDDFSNIDDATQKMVITGTGRVGIGVVSPAGKLQVTASGADGIVLDQDTSSTNNSSRLFFNSTSGNWAIFNNSHNLNFQSGAVAGATSGNYTDFTIATSGVICRRSFDVTTGDIKMRGYDSLGHDGTSLYIKAPANIYFYPGNVNKGYIDTTGLLTVVSLTESSSIRYKENIKPISNGLDIITQLNPVMYDRIDNGTKDEAGLIAEEVFKVLPNVVAFNEEGDIESIKYTRLIAYLVDAVKTLSAEVKELKNG